MEGARFLALLLYFEGRVEGRGSIAPLKREALLLYSPITWLLTSTSTCTLLLFLCGNIHVCVCQLTDTSSLVEMAILLTKISM